jgi:hypothetical protein
VYLLNNANSLLGADSKASTSKYKTRKANLGEEAQRGVLLPRVKETISMSASVDLLRATDHEANDGLQ